MILKTQQNGPMAAIKAEISSEIWRFTTHTPETHTQKNENCSGVPLSFLFLCGWEKQHSIKEYVYGLCKEIEILVIWIRRKKYSVCPYSYLPCMGTGVKSSPRAMQPSSSIAGFSQRVCGSPRLATMP